MFQLDLDVWYKDYADLIMQRKHADFSRVLSSFHASITVTSNYPETVPVSGEFYGIQQAVRFIGLLQHMVSIIDFSLYQVVKKGNLAVSAG